MTRTTITQRIKAASLTALFTLSSVIGSLALLPGRAFAFDAGDGSSDSPWRISTCDQLQSLNEDIEYSNDYFELAQSFSCSGITDFIPINFGESAAFSGSLDGKGFTISDLTMDAEYNNVGLFLRLNEAAVTNIVFDNASIVNDDSSYSAILAATAVASSISNITVTNSTVSVVSDSSRTGGLVAESDNSTYDNIDIDARVTASAGAGNMVGGLIGRSMYDQISNVTVQAGAPSEDPQIRGHNYVGGLVGNMRASAIEDSVSHANVSGADFAGGLVGFIYITGENSNAITGSSATGAVHGGQGVGGLVGSVVDDGAGGQEYVIHDSFAAGQVTGFMRVGGFIGNNAGVEIYNSFAWGDVVADQCECGPLGGFVGRQASEDSLVAYIHESFATGNVDQADGGVWYSGGFVGEMDGGNIENAYARGDTNGYEDFGGFAGRMNDGTILNVYSTGLVTPSGGGGLIGTATDGTVTSSFWDGDTAGQASSDGGIELTTEEATSITTYQEAGWDFTEEPIWTIGEDNNGYPCLAFYQLCNVTDEPSLESTSYITSALDGKNIVLAQTGCAAIDSAQSIKESSLSVQDPAYEYPVGLMDFTLTGCTGGTATVSIYFDSSTNPKDVVVRKYNSRTNAYTAVTGASVSKVTLSDGFRLLLSYQITDGGPHDQDGEVNGTIVDPIGLATNVVSAPNTGFGVR